MIEIIIKPVLTEKTLIQSSKGVFTFMVDLSANKNQIALAINKLYNVHVVSVKTLRLPGKTRRVGKKMTYITKSDWKKAIVMLKKGEAIEAFQISHEDPAKK
jgi:large subunit ribosomal protein L23